MHSKLIDILIIDDDAADRRLTELALKNSPQTRRFAIQMAGSLAEGVEFIKHQSFDLVLLDLGLPESRGLDTLENFRREYPHVPVVVLTGLQDEEAGVEAIRKGAIDYVTKPFKQDGLRTRISIALQMVELQNKLLLLANTDELTGLTNRRHFFAILEREILRAKIKGNPVSVMIFDLDHFKSINDTYGHLGGDMILKQVAKILQQSIYPLDIAARYGGDEFIVLMPGTPSDSSALRLVIEAISSGELEVSSRPGDDAVDGFGDRASDEDRQAYDGHNRYDGGNGRHPYESVASFKRFRLVDLRQQCPGGVAHHDRGKSIPPRPDR